MRNPLAPHRHDQPLPVRPNPAQTTSFITYQVLKSEFERRKRAYQMSTGPRPKPSAARPVTFGQKQCGYPSGNRAAENDSCPDRNRFFTLSLWN